MRGYPEKKKRNDEIYKIVNNKDPKKRLSYSKIGAIFNISKERVYKIVKIYRVKKKVLERE